MKILLAAGGNPENWPQPLLTKYDAYVGIDRGALYLLQAGYPVDLAVGEFDSLSNEEQEEVFAKAKEYARSPAEKDDTDTQLGILKTFERYPQAEVTLIGATGGRLDHLLANLWLGLEPRFKPFAHQLIIRDRQNYLAYYLPGKHIVRQVPSMKYLAYCCLTPVSALTLKGSKYVLENKAVEYPTSYASNEFLSDTAEFSFSDGMIAVIQSKD